MTDETISLPTRKEAHIDTIVCTENLCFAAIPVACAADHAAWHEAKRRKQAT